MIRRLTNANSDQVVDLILYIQQIEFGVPIRLEDQPDLLDIETFYKGSGGDMWGAFVDDQLVGTIALIANGHQAGTIRKMFVKKEYRGKEWGIAQQLLETLLEYCESHEITDLYLGTIEILKAACRFYERNGFFRIDKADLPSYFPLMAVDNTFYTIHLTK